MERPHIETAPVQPTLFIEGLPEDPKDLTAKNIEDLDNFLALHIKLTDETLISGPAFLRLFTYASPSGVSDAVLKEYLLRKGIKIGSNFPPEEPSNNIKFH